MRLDRGLVIVALAVVAAGCGTGRLPEGLAMPAGGREWIITVQNDSDAPAVLSVAEDTMPMGALVGMVRPRNVPPHTALEVTFVVPPGQGWAIFVNPTSERGPLIIAQDVPPDVSGRLPITIFVSPNGEPGAATDGELGPGWFGS